ncbi:MAG: hypothetical protein D6744_13905 [Planctomycetota bacterium]|nr:MAG: hypothetical protein D6744_13905 [Planctomycetota bacterium]
MKSIMTAAMLYQNDAKGRLDFPWTLGFDYKVGDIQYNYNWATEFVPCGGMTDKTSADWENSGLEDAMNASGLANSDINRIQPIHRPMNPYFAAEVTWNRLAKDRTKYPADIPGFFQCPSDRTALVPEVGASNTTIESDTPFRCWDWWGTSYPINWYWQYYYSSGGVGALLGFGRELMRGKDGRFASEFILFYENQANYALEAARPPGYNGGPWSSEPKQLIGWHGKLNRHVVGFLDGHAAYKYMNTAFVLGDDWTIWPNKPWKDTAAGNWSRFNNNVPE